MRGQPRQLVWLVLLCGSCTRIGTTVQQRTDGQGVDIQLYDGAVDLRPGEGSPDGPVRDLAARDAADLEQGVPPLCRYGTGRWLFGKVEHVSALSSAYDDSDLSFSPDALTVYFSSERGGGAGMADFYIAHRADRSAAFGQLANLSGLNSAYSEKSLSVTPDGLTAFFSSSRPGGPGSTNIWSGNRPSTQYPWSNEMVTVDWALSTTAADFDPVLPGAGLRLYYAIYGWSEGSGGQVLVVSERSSVNQAFSPPQLISELDAPSYRADPTLTADELVIIFSTDQPGGPGDDDLWYAVRSSLEAPFGAPAPLPEVNSVYRDMEPTLTPDGCELFFGSTRPGGLGSSDIYRVLVLEGP